MLGLPLNTKALSSAITTFRMKSLFPGSKVSEWLEVFSIFTTLNSKMVNRVKHQTVRQNLPHS